MSRLLSIASLAGALFGLALQPGLRGTAQANTPRPATPGAEEQRVTALLNRLSLDQKLELLEG